MYTMADYQRALRSLEEIAPMLATTLRNIKRVRIAESDDELLANAGACVSAKMLVLDGGWFSTLILEDQRYILSHEAWHLHQNLATRMKYCTPCDEWMWAAAIDMAANCLNERCGIYRKLLKQGWFPENEGFPRDLSIEDYVRLLLDKYGKDKKDSNGNPPKGTFFDRHDLASRIEACPGIIGKTGDDEDMITESTISELAAQSHGEEDISKRVYVESLGTKERKDWRNILRQMLSERGRGGRSYTRFSRRCDPETVIIPGNIRHVHPRLAFVVDFSISMKPLIAQVTDDLIDILREFSGGRYAFIGCDTQVQCFRENGEVPKTSRAVLDLYTGGCTDMAPAFALAKSRGYNKIICLTDGLVPPDNFREENVFWVWRCGNKDAVEQRMEKADVRHVCVN